MERRGRREAGKDRVAPLRRLEHQGFAARRHRREVREEGRQALRRRPHRVPPVAGQRGQTRYSTEINVRELIMLGSRSGGGGGDFDGESSRRAPAAAAAEGQKPAVGGRLRGFPERAERRGRRPAVLIGASRLDSQLSAPSERPAARAAVQIRSARAGRQAAEVEKSVAAAKSCCISHLRPAAYPPSYVSLYPANRPNRRGWRVSPP